MQSPKRLKLACYSANVTMAAVSNMSPLLFLTFREEYGISYSLLGTLVLVNFCTQLIIDLIFSFFSHKFNIALTVRIMPVISVFGLLLYAASPLIFGDFIYLGLALGTAIFSVATGLAEVLVSPLIAAVPSDNPDREMSKLHSVYAWGVVGVVIFVTFFLLLFGQKNWQLVPLFIALIPLTSAILFMTSKVPVLETPEKTAGAFKFLKNSGVWLCVFAIFLGGAAECTMAQWASGYIEASLGLPKICGDIFGVALFALTLGVGRTLYARLGKNTARVLFLGALGAAVCYIIAALSPIPVIGLIACALTGFCTSMLWPGNLIVASDRFPAGGVLIYALMAAGGDLGASLSPQLVGIAADASMKIPALVSLAEKLSLSSDALGMKAGMLIGALFPIAAIFVYSRFLKSAKRK